MDRELNGSFDYFLLDTPESNGAIQYVTGRMRELFKDDRIFEGWSAHEEKAYTDIIPFADPVCTRDASRFPGRMSKTHTW